MYVFKFTSIYLQSYDKFGKSTIPGCTYEIQDRDTDATTTGTSFESCCNFCNLLTSKHGSFFVLKINIITFKCI